MSYWIFADIGSDLPKSFVSKHERFVVLPQPYRLNGEEFSYKVGDEADVEEFYRKLREGTQASTSQITAQTYYDAFLPLVNKGESVLSISLSSGISGSFQSSVLARNMILEDSPEADIRLVDSLSASLGFGLLVNYALKHREQGMSLADNADWLEINRLKLNHWFTVDDLNFLYRGGRVTRGTALIGSMLQVKPIMNVNEEGKLIPRDKVTGRKRSLKMLADKVISLANPKEGQEVFISHGACRQEAQLVAEQIRRGLPGTGNIFISPVGAVIGSHSGPGTLAVFFMADGR